MTAITETGQTIYTAISPDGRYLAYVLREGGRRSLRLKQLATGSDVRIVPQCSRTIRTDNFLSRRQLHLITSIRIPKILMSGEFFVPSLGGPTTQNRERSRFRHFVLA